MTPATPVRSPRHAASLILLRDAPGGLEVLLLKRHGLSDVLGGAYVFPGGKLDAADALLDAALLDAPHDRLHALLGEPDLVPQTAAALFVAALREAYEECGVLLAEGGVLPTRGGAAVAASAFNDTLADGGLRLRVGTLLPWSRWITPVASPAKRFDTRFFVAHAPADVEARHDDHETTEAVWLPPRQALQRYWDGDINLAPPQIMTLAHLGRHAGVDSALGEARGRRPPLVLPELEGEFGHRRLYYPGDAAHSVRERAMPGPTRLLEREGRFMPEAGFDAFFA
ncbi:MAG: NUDIX hydrolase [Burkholderiales bacterium]